MRPGLVLLLAATFAATAVLPGLAAAAEDHSAHGAEGPANPMLKQALLYLDASGGLSTTPAAAGVVPAGPSTPAGESTPVVWQIAATKNTLLDSSIFVELYAQVIQPTLVAGGPEGAAFEIALLKNGEPVEGAVSLQNALSGPVVPGDPVRMKLFLAQPDGLALAPGDTLGLSVRYFGLNPEQQPAVQYVVGGDQGSRIGFRLRLASLDELGLATAQLGGAKVAPLEGFDFRQESKKDPNVKEFQLKAFQFGFRGGPLVVPNGSKVVVHLTVDETLSTSTEGHAGHGHADGNLSWDQNKAEPLHGFAVQAFNVNTVAFDGLVTTVSFVADQPGNHTFLCTVFCGSGHGRMTDVLTVQGAPGVDVNSNPDNTQTLGPNNAPGLEAVALLAALGAAAVLARRRA